jgi:hypothetical protein
MRTFFKESWETSGGIRMNWVKAITGVLVLWASTAWGATLVWDANSESNLEGYRVYYCGGLPCTLNVGASLLTGVGKNETSLYIGTPADVRYYFVTAFNSFGESGPSNLVVVRPAGSPPPPPTPGGLQIGPQK